jgi:hypothetical protein
MGGPLVPLARLGEILPEALLLAFAAIVDRAEVVHGVRIALIGGVAQEVKRLRVVLRRAPAVPEADADVAG